MARRKTKKKKKIDWKRVRKVSMWAGLIWGGYELYYAAVLRKQRRRDVFNMALQRAHETGKPLYVVGDPKRGLARVLGADFDCVDGCITEAEAANLAAGSAVIFAPEVLERAQKPKNLYNALVRASGGDLFASPYGRWTLLAYLPPQRRWLYSAPPKSAYFEYRNLPWIAGKSEKIRVAGLRRVS